MLDSGWIFDLFPKEDFEGFVSNNRGEAKGAGVHDTNEDLTNYFLDKMKK